MYVTRKTEAERVAARLAFWNVTGHLAVQEVRERQRKTTLT